jgi:hypothetical protein
LKLLCQFDRFHSSRGFAYDVDAHTFKVHARSLTHHFMVFRKQNAHYL